MKDKEMKTLLISKELHNRLKDCSEKSGIKLKHLTETAIEEFLKRIEEEEQRKWS
jgi:hypothetical protein